MHPSRFPSVQVLTPLLEHNLKHLLVEKYGLVDSDLEHEIDRNLNYHENLDNILSIHGLADEVTHYEVQRELELIEKQLETRFGVDGRETKPLHIEPKPLITNLVRNDKENRFEEIFDKYFDLFYGERLIPAASLAGVAWKIVESKPKLEQRLTENLLDADKSKHRHKDMMGAGAIESFDKLWSRFFNKAKNKRKKLRRKKAKGFLKKWEKILCPNV